MSDFQIPDKVMQEHPEVAGAALRDEAMERVYDAAAPEVKADFRRAIKQVAAASSSFTSDQVWEAMICHPAEPRVLGPMMRWAQSEGICERTEETTLSVLPQNHRRPIRVWRSLIEGELQADESVPLAAAVEKWPRESPGYGLVCFECHCPIDGYVRGNHAPGCSNAVHNTSLFSGREEFAAFVQESP